MDKAVIKQKVHHDQGAELFPFMEGDEVWVQRPTSKGYDEGVVVRWTGDLSSGGQVKRKHADQLKIKMASEQGMLRGIDA